MPFLNETTTANSALLLLRVALGVLFIAHGARKQFGSWSGPGMQRFAEVVAGLGFRPALPFAVAATWCQLIGGVALIVGLGTSLAAALIALTMLVAMRLQWKHGFWDASGWQYPGVLFVVLGAIALMGPGDYSIDAQLR